MPTRTVAVDVFGGVKVLDPAGPFGVFSTAARVASRQAPGAPPVFEVHTVGQGPGLVRARGGLLVQPNHRFASAPKPDVLVVPGGVVTAGLDRPEGLTWVRETGGAAEPTASVCTGAFLLAEAGLLDGRRAGRTWTTWPPRFPACGCGAAPPGWTRAAS